MGFLQVEGVDVSERRTSKLATLKETHYLKNRRVWTAQEEQLMRQQSFGDFSMHQLEKLVKGSRESIIPHMKEIGLEPRIHLHRNVHIGASHKNNLPEHWAMNDGYDSAPTVGSDKLLQRLNAIHPDRRYA